MTSSTVRSPTTSRITASDAARMVSSGSFTSKRYTRGSEIRYWTVHSTSAILRSPVTRPLHFRVRAFVISTRSFGVAESEFHFELPPHRLKRNDIHAVRNLELQAASDGRVVSPEALHH